LESGRSESPYVDLYEGVVTLRALNAESPKLTRTTIVAAIFAERWLISLFFFFLGWTELQRVNAIVAGRAPLETTRDFDIARHFTLLLLDVLSGGLLLIARRPKVAPGNLKLIVVPLITTFYTFMYHTIPYYPAALQASLAPTDWQRPFLYAGIACVIVGPAIGLWGLLHLGRSFGVIVTVREVVLSGPYRWVRHPMYLGWIVTLCGVVCMRPAVAYIFHGAVHIGLLVYRARLEEGQLSASSPEYQQAMLRSGFILPRFFSRKKP
jgi:protein-S-isoprenylcysteine O-methyltransferase Ste14